MVLKKIVKTDLVKLIRNDIIRGEFTAGAHLRLDKLATRFNVSTMPIREALRALEAEGIVYSIPHRGSFVTEFSVDELLDIFEMRAVLEQMATRDAVPHLTETLINQLQIMVDNWRAESDDIALMVDQNDDFHKLIYQQAKRPHLYKEIMVLRNRTPHYLRSYTDEMGHFDNAKQTHQLLVDAFRVGNIEDASILMFNHVWDVGQALANYIRDKNNE